MNICALIPTWKRKDITIETVKQLLNQTIPPNNIVIVGSCDEDREASEVVGVNYLEVPNQPLGAKIQAGVKYCRQFNPDALLLSGSDDWLSSNWLETLSPHLQEYDLIGSDHLYLMRCSQQHPLQIGRCTYVGSKRENEPMGPGRLLSRRILDKIRWKLYPTHIKDSLDGHSWGILLGAGCKVWLEKEDKIKILSFKGDCASINSWDNIVLYNRIKEIIKDPKQWLKDNFPNTLERLYEIGIWPLQPPIPVSEPEIVPEPEIVSFPIKIGSKVEKSLNIVMLSSWDFGGSGWQIVQSVRQHTSHNIVHIKRFNHKCNYPREYVLDGKNRRQIRQLIEEADIIHFKGDEIPFRHWDKFIIPKEAKIVLTVAGTGFRRSQNGCPSPMAKEWFPFQHYIKRSDFRTALTPDLNYPRFDSIYTQELIDSESVNYCWKKSEVPTIGYFPSFKNRKGYDTHIRPALDQLKQLGYQFNEFPTMGITYEESVELKKEMTIFIDQIAWPGGYGNSALEAMQFGIPVIAYISETAKAQSHSEEFCNSPILNPGFTVEGLVTLLKKILDQELDLKPISIQTKQYCDTFHGYSRGAKMWDEIYQKVINQC